MDYSGDALIKVRLFLSSCIWSRSANDENNVKNVNNDGSRNYNNVNNQNLGSVPDLPYKASILLVKSPEVIVSKWNNPVLKAKESYSFSYFSEESWEKIATIVTNDVSLWKFSRNG